MKKLSRAEAGKLGREISKGKLLQWSAEQRRRAQERYALQEKKCLLCEKSIPYESRANIYCSQSCAAAANNRKVPRRKPPNRGNNSCLDCNLWIRAHKKFCGRPCQIAYRDRLTEARLAELGAFKTDTQAKKYLLRKHGRRCMCCGLSEWQGQSIPIQMDHINGRSDDRSIQNLRLLCPNCHAQTPTFGSRNRGNASSDRNKKRRRRYHNG